MNHSVIKKQAQKQLSNRVYWPRVIVYVFVSLLFSVGFYHQILSSFFWSVLLVFCLIWPHVAYFAAVNHPHPVKAEFYNFAIDSFFGGMTLPLLSFSIIPTIAILSVYNISSISVGGLRLFLKGSLFLVLGVLLFTAIPLGTPLGIAALPAINFACIPLLLLYPVIVAFNTYNVSRINNMDKINIELQNLKLEAAFKKIKNQHEVLKNLAQSDGLTGIPNRRRFDEYLASQWENAQRSNTALSAIMIDIDFFKEYNDFYGHGYGDECLKMVADTLLKTLKRPNDMLARYGGDEFVCLLPATDLKGAEILAGQMNKNVIALGIPHERSHVSDWVTVSIGVSFVLPSRDYSYSILLENADNALYKAKRGPRNCVKSLNCYKQTSYPRLSGVA